MAKLAIAGIGLSIGNIAAWVSDQGFGVGTTAITGFIVALAGSIYVLIDSISKARANWRKRDADTQLEIDTQRESKLKGSLIEQIEELKAARADEKRLLAATREQLRVKSATIDIVQKEIARLRREHAEEREQWKHDRARMLETIKENQRQISEGRVEHESLKQVVKSVDEKATSSLKTLESQSGSNITVRPENLNNASA